MGQTRLSLYSLYATRQAAASSSSAVFIPLCHFGGNGEYVLGRLDSGLEREFLDKHIRTAEDHTSVAKDSD